MSKICDTKSVTKFSIRWHKRQKVKIVSILHYQTYLHNCSPNCWTILLFSANFKLNVVPLKINKVDRNMLNVV